MIDLIRLFSLRHARRHPLRILLSMMAVALGVALFVSSDTTNYSVQRGFEAGSERLAGGAQLRVFRGVRAGIESEALARIDAVEGISAAPILKCTTTLPDFPSEGTFMLIGMDPVREAKFRRWEDSAPASEADGGTSPAATDLAGLVFGGGVAVPRSFVERNGLERGAKLVIDTPDGRATVPIAAVLADNGGALVHGGSVGVMALPALARLFGRTGLYDQIDIMTDRDPDSAAAELRETLGEGYVIGPPESEQGLSKSAMGHMRALMGISAIALIVGVFIIYNSVSISVVERVREIGILRGIGATRGQIFAAILIEWAVVGSAGSALGVLIGFVLAGALLQATVAQVNALIPLVRIDEVAIRPMTGIAAFGLGIATTLAASWFPARAAMSIPPVGMMREGVYRMDLAEGLKFRFRLGCVMMILSAAAWTWLPRVPLMGLGSAVTCFIGTTLALPLVVVRLSARLRPVLGRLFGPETWLAADNIAKSPDRTALTVVALAGTLAMMVSAASLVGSFKDSGTAWMRDTFPFDCAINSSDASGSFYSETGFSEQLVTGLINSDDIALSYGIRATLKEFEGLSVLLVALDIRAFNEMHRLNGTPLFIPPDIEARLSSGEGIVVSENFAALARRGVGDRIALAAVGGPAEFEILAEVEDYSWTTGTLFMDLDDYRTHWRDDDLSFFDVKFKPGVDPAEGRARLAEAVGGRHTLFVYDARDLIVLADETLDQTLRFTNLQVAVAVLIGFMGIVNTLLISVLQRTRELGLLRAVGMTRRQTVGMIVIESMALSLSAGLIGVVIGLLGAAGPLALHVFQITGFVMPLNIPTATITMALASSVAIGFLAGAVPARHAARIGILDSISYE